MTQIAFIDWVGLTFPGSRDETAILTWVSEFVRVVFGAGQVIEDTGHGWNGYRKCFSIEGIGSVSYGGNRETVHFEISGTGCAQVRDWEDLRQAVEEYNGRITRVDVAADVFDGVSHNFEWVRQQYEQGGFDPSCGARPNALVYQNLGEKKGDTFYVGDRGNGKMFRGYEKGKEQKIPDSPWFRLEVEYRAKHRVIPLQILTNPGAYFAGAYPCLADFNVEQIPVKTFAYSAAACIKKAVDHAKKQAGRAVHALVTLNGGDVVGAFAVIHKPELPKRLAGYVRAILSKRETGEVSPVMFSAHPHDIKILDSVLSALSPPVHEAFSF